MPENAMRRRHLYDQLVRSTPGATVRDMAEREQRGRIRAEHPDWPNCTAGCGWPINPAALGPGQTTHPTCDPYDEPTTAQETADART